MTGIEMPHAFDKMMRLSVDDVECISNAFGLAIADATSADNAIALHEFAVDIAGNVSNTAVSHTDGGAEQAFVMLKVAIALAFCVFEELERNDDTDDYEYLKVARELTKCLDGE